ncbi:MAG TPA: hypothetical protein VFG98_01125 [Intrasporangium sp.]|nr:hypothetical protein [Intrasporangium sp.]
MSTRGEGTVSGTARGNAAAGFRCITSTVFIASSNVRYRHAAAPTVASPSRPQAAPDPVRAWRPNSIAMKTSTPQAISVTVIPPARKNRPRPAELRSGEGARAAGGEEEGGAEGAEGTEEDVPPRAVGRSGPRATRRPEYLLMSSTLLLTGEVGVTHSSGP